MLDSVRVGPLGTCVCVYVCIQTLYLVLHTPTQQLQPLTSLAILPVTLLRDSVEYNWSRSILSSCASSAINYTREYIDAHVRRVVGMVTHYIILTSSA